MQVRRRDAAGAAHGAHLIAAAHFLAGVHVDAREVRVISLEAAAMIDTTSRP